MAVIGIDAGASKTAGLVLDRGNITHRARVPTDASSPQGVEKGLLEVCSRLLEKASREGTDIEAIGLGIAGFIDYKRGVVIEAPNHPLRNYPAREVLETRFELPVCVENDANAWALAEALMGAGKGLRYLVHLTLGTGIGGGMVMDGSIYRGALGTAAEPGHMVILENGPPCNCGGRGCLESLVSGMAIYRRVEEMAAAGRKSPVTDEFLADPEAFDAADVCRHADAGDEMARSILNDAGAHLGTGIASLVNLLNPDAVTLSGGLLASFHHMEESMRRSFDSSAIKVNRDHVRILKGTLGDDGGSLGAALLASSPH
jgi:glucokinase